MQMKELRERELDLRELAEQGEPGPLQPMLRELKAQREQVQQVLGEMAQELPQRLEQQEAGREQLQELRDQHTELWGQKPSFGLVAPQNLIQDLEEYKNMLNRHMSQIIGEAPKLFTFASEPKSESESEENILGSDTPPPGTSEKTGDGEHDAEENPVTLELPGLNPDPQ